MSQFHEYQCNCCGVRVSSQYNGEHFLPPVGWMALLSPHTTQTDGNHICPRCFKKHFKFQDLDPEGTK